MTLTQNGLSRTYDRQQESAIAAEATPRITGWRYRGRKTHRDWVERHCRHLLSGFEGEARERMVRAATVATDLSTWKLLRRDLMLEPAQVAEVMTELLHGLERRT